MASDVDSQDSRPVIAAFGTNFHHCRFVARKRNYQMISRNAKLLVRAMELAESGYHIDCITIEAALVAEGYHDAPELLRDRRLRRSLRMICRKHWHPEEYSEAVAGNVADLVAKNTRAKGL